MNNKVYIVTAGEYSDYHIEAAFSTKEKAKAFVNAHNDDYYLEEYELDEQKVKEDERLYKISYDLYGGKIEVERVYERDNVYFDRYKDVVQYFDGFGGALSILYFFVRADGKEKAKKIAEDRKMEIKAHGFCFPFLFQKCVKSPNNKYIYPRYNYYTKEIVLEEGEKIITPFDKFDKY